MRKILIFFVVCLSILIPVSARAQGPTPPPSAFQLCLDEKWGECAEKVLQDYGVGLTLLVILAVILLTAVRDKLKDVFKGALNVNPFAWTLGLHRYLKVFIAEHRIFGFRGMDYYAIKAIDLTNAYIQLDLNFSKLAEKDKRKKGEDSLPDKAMMQGREVKFDLAQILQAGYKKVAVVGDAGSGKSALMQWAGMTVAQGCLFQKLSAEQKAFLKAIRFNPMFRRYVPLIVPLRKFYAHCRDNKLHVDANSLHAYICGYSKFIYGKDRLPENLFHRFLRKGCLVMFDGMDEVEYADRPNVRAAIEGVVSDVGNSSRNIYLVTTRPSAAEVTSQLVGFETALVLPITHEKREQMINLWCNSVYPTLTEADNHARSLLWRIENPLVNEMAVTPLMINIFALVYFHKRDLPSQRAELFEQAVKALLTDPHKQGQAVSDVEFWGGRSVNQRFDDMALIAYILHDQGKVSIFADELVSEDIFWKRFGDEKNRELAQQKASEFLDLVARRGGLLRQDGKSYDFYIRRFREFLAGHYVAQKMEEQWDAVLQRHIHAQGDQWVEPFLLSVGYLAYSNDNKAKKLMRSLLHVAEDHDRHDYAFTIAGIALADILKNPTEQVISLFADEKKKLPPILLGVFEKNPPVLSVDLRQRLGLALAEIGDPRFVPDKETKSILPHLVTIPGENFRMGTSEEDEKIIKEQGAKSWDDEKPAHEIVLSEYTIGKYPVTNAEFRCFMEQGGYDPKAKWWSEDGRKWRTGAWESDLSWISDEETRRIWKDWLAGRPVERRDRPFWWDDPRWDAANLPVVGITWFEAEAYCNWLSEMTSKNFRLPTEAEWEHAARGAQNFIWAWGNEWDAEKANTDEAEKKIGGTSPAGMYPHGASSYKVHDMIGNVWEWCLDWYDENEYRNRKSGVQNPRGPETGSARVLRGGSWYFNRDDARCSVRYGYGPGSFLNYVGFRLVCSPSFPTLNSDSLHSESLSK
jgi:formylglycine-generating enzyme required for sulfatase activity